ncbi:MAG: glycosyltransferase [Planctomycetota bacterium]
MTEPTSASTAVLATPPATAPEGGGAVHRLRVLVSAFATSPYAGSEPGGGWNVVYRLAAHHDVTVLCSPGLQNEVVEAFDRFVAEHGPISGLTVEWIKPPPVSWLLQREGTWQRAFYYHGYRSWEKAAARRALALHARRPFDLVHRLNMTGFREPGYLWKMDLPYLWGPIAGAVMMPRPFFELLSFRDRVFYAVRNTLNARQMRTKTRCRKAAARSAKLWVVDELNRAMVRDFFGRESALMLDSGCQPTDDGFVRDFDGTRPLRVLWSGVHEGRKCLPILLHALAKLKEDGRAVELTVLAEGPETANWKRLCASLGLDDVVTWTGRLPQPEAVAKMKDADVFVLTSLQEAATHVVMESLASGLPVICHDACGMGVAINETSGIKVPLIDPPTSITGFAGALASLIDQPGRIAELSAGAMVRAEQLSWENKVIEIAETYSAVFAEANGRSDLAEGLA